MRPRSLTLKWRRSPGARPASAASSGAGRRASSYLLGMPMLGDWLEEGLEAIGA